MYQSDRIVIATVAVLYLLCNPSVFQLIITQFADQQLAAFEVALGNLIALTSISAFSYGVSRLENVMSPDFIGPVLNLLIVLRGVYHLRPFVDPLLTRGWRGFRELFGYEEYTAIPGHITITPTSTRGWLPQVKSFDIALAVMAESTDHFLVFAVVFHRFYEDAGLVLDTSLAMLLFVLLLAYHGYRFMSVHSAIQPLLLIVFGCMNLFDLFSRRW